MTTPVVSPIEPKKNKTWLVTAASVVGLLISLLTWVAPVLPEKFSAIALVVLGILTPIGTFLAKYKESDEVLVKESDVNIVPDWAESVEIEAGDGGSGGTLGHESSWD